jgi:hypothetical protein
MKSVENVISTVTIWSDIPAERDELGSCWEIVMLRWLRKVG